MRVRRLVAVGAVAGLGALLVPGSAPEAAPLPLPMVIAPPGAAVAGFATPELTMAKGASLELWNLDVVSHDVTSRAKGKDGKPLFKARFSGTGMVAVEGVQKLAPGTYAFFCTPHTAMIGTLTVT